MFSLLAKPLVTLLIIGSTTMIWPMEALNRAFEAAQGGVRISMGGFGTAMAFVEAAAGRADLGMASRWPTPEEASQLIVTPIALDAIAVAVHPSNPVNGLTREQLRQIYTGELTRWEPLGGPSCPIVAISREYGSGTRQSFDGLVMHKEKQSGRIGQEDMEGFLRGRILENPCAIGYLSLAKVDGRLKALAIDGVLPSAASVRGGSYPLTRPFLLVRAKGQENPLAEAFVRFVLSPTGQAVLAAYGYFPP